jgi:hypothetical protein
MKHVFWFVNAVIVASTAFYVYNVALREAKITGEYNSAGIEKKHESSHTKNNDAPAQEVEDVTDMETAEKLLKTRSPYSSFPITFEEAKEIIESKAAMKGLPDNKKIMPFKC